MPERVVMEVLEDLGDTVILRCACGHVFMSSPCGEENVEWDDNFRCLFSTCPKCRRQHYNVEGN